MGETASWVERVRNLDRREIETRTADLVERDRFEIAVVVPVVGAITLTAGARGIVPPEVAFTPLLVLAGTAVMRLPLFAGLAPLVDYRASALLLGLCGYAYAIEFVGVTTGWPYGAFAYGVELGPTVGGVPLALPLFFLPLVCNAYLLVLRVLGRSAETKWIRLPVALAVVLAIDLVLDPGAVALGFWSYAGGGPYYGVPLSNYLGWCLSGSVGVVLFDRAFDGEDLLARLDDRAFLLDDLASFVVLWGLVNLAFANWIPVVLSAGLAASLLAANRSGVEADLAPGFRR